MTVINEPLFPREVLFMNIYKKCSKILYIPWAEFQTSKKALVLLGRSSAHMSGVLIWGPGLFLAQCMMSGISPWHKGVEK